MDPIQSSVAHHFLLHNTLKRGIQPEHSDLLKHCQEGNVDGAVDMLKKHISQKNTEIWGNR